MDTSHSHTLVTGAAGFIGYHVAAKLLADGQSVIGLDNLNNYYDVRLKKARLQRLHENAQFQFEPVDITDSKGLEELFQRKRIPRVVHLAAQAGVRYSILNPQAYVASNLIGFANIIECCRHTKVEHLVYASSSSVYGGNTRMPFSVHDNVDHPVSLYAATKKANELIAHSYAHLYGLPSTGLRFFTVYGPWGRPDMAAFLFAKAILEDKPIELYNNGRMQRDFTYIDDIVDGILRVLACPPKPNENWSRDNPDPGTSWAPYRVYNIGNHTPVELLRFVEILEKLLGRTAKKKFLPIQPGDVPATCADITDLMQNLGFVPRTPIEVGLERFVKWYREYFQC